MAKAKSKTTKKKTGDFALRPPNFSILSDHPLKENVAFDIDRFNLRYWVGPVYDIIRHKDTKMPMTIAIYGGWGTGKTTAMKWLHGLLDDWNEEPTNGIRVWPVWFYPWKYQNKEDVWRGLIAEVILNSMNVIPPDAKTIAEAFKTAAIFIGKSALDLANATTVKLGPLEITGKVLKDVRDNLKDAVYPEKAYLNPYEKTIEDWLKKTLSGKQRMVIFIDDLDRCMPEIALQVLEALKLYLNIEKLIFVVGVDNVIVEKLVVEHYKRLGLIKDEDEKDSESEKEDIIVDKQRAKNYLSKMFQVEVKLAPSEKQINEFFDEQIKTVEYWKKLSPQQKKLFHDLILDRAGKNPREVKRLINSAVMRGAGALMQSGEAK